ncbi:FG-GAP-like repeat-containing protein [Roseivirga pacifica]|uniref:FG-GAP-like repeat-containing protein n=1 Tax=Roseivirga pacifica TaxID=1267423 RepID=UPI00227B337F|nr:FG-GAP-like repeat-containing protein [Roseivirga pacifica]
MAWPALLVGFFVSNLLTAQQVPFSDWANQSGLQVPFGMGVSLVDVNQDGYEDVFIARKNRDNLLYLNLVDGTFEDISAAAGVDYIGTSLQSIWADYDQDGDLDFFLGTAGGQQNLLYRNNGDLTFTEVSETAGVNTTVHAIFSMWGDVNGDGWSDLFVFALEGQNHFYLNKGNGTFKDYTVEAGVVHHPLSMGASLFDFDHDGDLDLYETHDGKYGNFLYQNDGEGHFTDVSEAFEIYSESSAMGVSIGDFNNDGWEDIYLTNLEGNFLFRNNGGTSFSEIGASAGIADEGMGWGVSWLDYDNDGWLDLYVANDSYYSDYPNVLYRNNGDETFSIVEADTDKDKGSYATAIGDINRDGRMDLLLANRGNTDYNQVFLNQTIVGNWLSVRLLDPEHNDLAGSRVSVTGEDFLVTRWHYAGTSWSADDADRLHFGLGNHNAVSLTVLWPDGLEERYESVPINGHVLLTKGSGLTEEDIPPIANLGNSITSIADETFELAVYPNPFTDLIWVDNNSFEFEIYTYENKLIYRSSKVYESINTSGWKSGLYFLILVRDSDRIVKKLWKQ